jgi:hypothetical protein
VCFLIRAVSRSFPAAISMSISSNYALRVELFSVCASWIYFEVDRALLFCLTGKLKKRPRRVLNMKRVHYYAVEFERVCFVLNKMCVNVIEKWRSENHSVEWKPMTGNLHDKWTVPQSVTKRSSSVLVRPSNVDPLVIKCKWGRGLDCDWGAFWSLALLGAHKAWKYTIKGEFFIQNQQI